LARVGRYWVCALALCGFASSSQLIPAQEAENSSPSATAPDQSAMTIGPGDVIDLSVYHVPDLTLRVRVDSHGVVSLPLIGDLKLAGMTVRDAQLSIAHELVDRQLVKRPEVSLFIEESAAQGITVSGEVNTPGIYPLAGPHKLYQAISAAGGLTAKAGHRVIILHAGRDDRKEVIDLLADESLDKVNVAVYPGDTIIVSKAGVVYVVGEVNKPGAFLMEDNTSMSLMKAIALAGSTTKTASLKHAMIFRKTPEGSVEMEVSLENIYHAKSSDIQLHAEDIVFVPLSNLKSYGAMGIQAAVQAAVYSIYAAELHN
jgi:polysaccharide biosynthesis/export protein